MAKLARLTQKSFLEGVEFTITGRMNQIYFSLRENNRIMIVDNHDKRDVATAVTVSNSGFVAQSSFFGQPLKAEVKFENCWEILR